MAIKTWLLGGVSISDHILDSYDSCWNRPDLVNVPNIMKYTKYRFDKTNTYLFENNIGIVVALTPYATFESIDDIKQDFYLDSSDSLYSAAYKQMIEDINLNYPFQRSEDVDWIIPIIEGELDIQENYCVLNGIGNESKEFVSLIDCSFVYTSLQHISDFVQYICSQKRLTKYQRWQLAYYQMAVQAVENPKVFLTNKEEIEIYSQLYKCWRVDESLQTLLNHTNQAVNLFSFLSNYEENEENDLFSSFLTFFGIVVGLEAIYNLFAALFNDIDTWFRLVFLAIIAVVVVWFAIVFSKKAIKKHIEKSEFIAKTTYVKRRKRKKDNKK